MGAPNTSPQALAWKSGTMAMIDVALLRLRASGIAIVKVCRKLARCEYSTPCRQWHAISGEAKAPALRVTPQQVMEWGCGEEASAVVAHGSPECKLYILGTISAITSEIEGCPSCGQTFIGGLSEAAGPCCLLSVS